MEVQPKEIRRYIAPNGRVPFAELLYYGAQTGSRSIARERVAVAVGSYSLPALRLPTTSLLQIPSSPVQ